MLCVHLLRAVVRIRYLVVHHEGAEWSGHAGLYIIRGEVSWCVIYAWMINRHFISLPAMVPNEVYRINRPFVRMCFFIIIPLFGVCVMVVVLFPLTDNPGCSPYETANFCLLAVQGGYPDWHSPTISA